MREASCVSNLNKLEKKEKLTIFLVVMAFLIGNFVIAGLSNVTIICSLILFSVLLISNKINKTNMYLSIVFLALVFIYTLTSPYEEYVIGSLLLYLNLSVLFMIVIKDIKFSEKILKFIDICMIVILALGVLITIGNSAVMDLLANNFMIYPNKEYQIIEELKPIIFYDMHSLAGFFLFIFSFLNIERFKKNKSVINLICSVGFIYLLLKLVSNTSLYLIIILLVYILISYLIDLYKKNKLTLKRISAIIGIVFIFSGIVGVFVSGDIAKVLALEGNGLSGRYSEDGVLASNMEFIKKNPLKGVGITYTKKLYWGDSGLIENMTRVSVVGTIIYYLMLFLFIKENIKSKVHMVFVFVSFMLLEVGMSLIFYFRTPLVIPVLIVYLNSLDSGVKEKGEDYEINIL